MFGDETPYILQTQMFKKKKKKVHKRFFLRTSGRTALRDYFCTKKAQYK
jgi:hypothetical protein